VRTIKPRNRKLALLELRYINDTPEDGGPFAGIGGGPWVLTCGGAVIEAWPIYTVRTVRALARGAQKRQWSDYRVATELRFWNRDGTPASGPGSRSTWPRSADPRRSKG